MNNQLEELLKDNFLDGEEINDCGNAMFSAYGALDIAKFFYELGQKDTLRWVEEEVIGEDEDTFVMSSPGKKPVIKVNVENDVYVDRNKLRAEQRQKLKELKEE